jgi:hypothetical protein
MGIGPLSLAVKRPVRDTDIFIPLYAFCGVYKDNFLTATASIRGGTVVLAMLVFLLCCNIVKIENSTAQCINRTSNAALCCCVVVISSSPITDMSGHASLQLLAQMQAVRL